jgi:hypothetical protein
MVNSDSGREPLPPAVAVARNWSYVHRELPGKPVMSALVSSVRLSRPLLLVAAGGALAVAATLALWAYYGTAVFFEVVRAGWAACF